MNRTNNQQLLRTASGFLLNLLVCRPAAQMPNHSVSVLTAVYSHSPGSWLLSHDNEARKENFKEKYSNFFPPSSCLEDARFVASQNGRGLVHLSSESAGPLRKR